MECCQVLARGGPQYVGDEKAKGGQHGAFYIDILLRTSQPMGWKSDPRFGAKVRLGGQYYPWVFGRHPVVGCSKFLTHFLSNNHQIKYSHYSEMCEHAPVVFLSEKGVVSQKTKVDRLSRLPVRYD